MPQTDPFELQVQDLGRMPYAAAFDVQRRAHDRVLAAATPMTLLLVEHDPVITISRRRDSPRHLRAAPERLARLGIDVQPTNRGGDITYHGPGQLVAYPILRLDTLGLNVGRYVRWLEQVVIDTVERFGIQAHRDPRARGVWVAAANGSAKPHAAKLCAVGVRVQRNVTLHGLALNVTTNLDHFNTIIPCGLPDRGVTSLQQLLGDDTPTMQQVKHALVSTMRSHIRRLTKHRYPTYSP